MTLEWLKDTGTIDEACFPYEADGTISCESACPDWRNRTWRIEDWGWVYPSLSNIKGYLLEGPLPTGMIIYEDFHYYDGGVYEHVWGEETGSHLVTIVGWDDTNQSWICKNSWGTGWGEGGWFRIKYGECSIEDGTAYLVDVYAASSPTITIETDKIDYTRNDTMHVDLNITNPGGAQTASIYVGLERPEGGAVWFINKPSVTLPARLDYSKDKVFTLLSIPDGTYTWHAILDDPATGLIICKDTAEWEFVPMGATVQAIDVIIPESYILIRDNNGEER